MQLKKPDRALEYVREAIQDVETGASVLRLNLPKIAIWLMLKRLEQEEKGITMNLINESDFSKIGSWEKDILSYLEALIPHIAYDMSALPADSRNWSLCFSGKNPLAIRFILPRPVEAEIKNVFKRKLSLLKSLDPVICTSKDPENLIYQINISISPLGNWVK